MDKPNTVPIDTVLINHIEFIQRMRKLEDNFDCDLEELANKIENSFKGMQEEINKKNKQIETIMEDMAEFVDDREDWIGE